MKYGTCNGALFLDNGNLFSHILQFAYVAVPRIVHQIFAGIVGEKDGRHVVLLGHVGREFAKEERHVLTTFA